MQAIRYQIAPMNPHAHLFEVRCTVDDPDPAGQRFRLPAWIPGSYLIREFARHFVSMCAPNAAGGAVRDRKEREGHLARRPGSRTAHGDRQRLRLRPCRCAPPISTRTRGYFNGPSVFLLPGRRAKRALHGRHRRARGRRRRALARRDDAAARRRSAARLRTLSRGELRRADRSSGRDGRLRARVVRGGRRARTTSRSPAGTMPTSSASRATSRACANGRSTCSAARRSSRARSTATCSRSRPSATATAASSTARARASCARATNCPHAARAKITDDYLHASSGLASHEYFHSWNVKRIKPAAFMPYDLDARELHAPALGVRGHHVLLRRPRARAQRPHRRQRAISSCWAARSRSVLRTPGRHVQSVADSSFDAWIKFYRQDENSPERGRQLLREGLARRAGARPHAAQATARTSLDDVMRALWRALRPAPASACPRTASRSSSPSSAGATCTTSSRAMCDGTDDPPLDALLDAFGVEWHVRPANGPKDRGGKPASGPVARVLAGRKGCGRSPAAARLHRRPRGARGTRSQRCAGGHRRLARLHRIARFAAVRSRPPASTSRVHAFRRDELISRRSRVRRRAARHVLSDARARLRRRRRIRCDAAG